jgi:hypothetical protein
MIVNFNMSHSCMETRLVVKYYYLSYHTIKLENFYAVNLKTWIKAFNRTETKDPGLLLCLLRLLRFGLTFSWCTILYVINGSQFNIIQQGKKNLALQRTKRQMSHQKARQPFPFRILLGNAKESSLNMLR